MEIESDFNTNRANLPPIFIATPYDKKKSVFTKDSPNAMILFRIIELCSNALNVIEEQIYTKGLIDSKVSNFFLFDIFKSILIVYIYNYL